MRKLYLWMAGLLSAGALAFAALPAQVSAQNYNSAKQAACEGVLAGGGGSCNDSSKLDSVIGTAINILSAVVGVAAVIMIIISGLRYVTSGGDSSGIASAKRTLIYALVGLVIAGLAQFIVRFVLQRL